ncbi:MAG: 4-coumarate--CoA ligase family protein [Acidobacteria bacterium]|nr:MAG: 4-coumarate--CoA ligase family protein [Acidobacteriota bacterium]
MIFRSPYPEVTIPETPLTPFVLARAQALGAKPALVDGVSGRAISYAELAEQVRRIAAGLAARGLSKGDVFAILSPNALEYALAFHGVALAGGVVTTINPHATTEEVAHQLKDAGAKFLLAAPACLEKAVAARTASVRELFVIGEAQAGATPFVELLDNDGRAPEVEIEPRADLAALPYSSGTTGRHKGVMLTHHNLVANLCQIAGTGQFTADDTLICVLPLFHIYGMQVIMNAGLYAGATIVMLPRFDLHDVLRVIETHRVTFAHFVPPIMLTLAKQTVVDNYDLSSLKTIFSGAAPLSAEIARACAARFGCQIKQGYGMTETAPGTHMAPLDPDNVRCDSIGWCVPNMECKIVDCETGAELGTGARGEIWVRGPQVMPGYLNNPTATAQTIDTDGWLHTGDIGYVDAAGYFYIVDRLKELIKYKGFQVAPAELEAVLLTHPSVADAAVVPSPDAEAGEVPKAFVVLKTDDATRDATTMAEELLAYVAARVAPHKKIRRLEFIEQIPKSASGKILRRLLVVRERGM